MIRRLCQWWPCCVVLLISLTSSGHTLLCGQNISLSASLTNMSIHTPYYYSSDPTTQKIEFNCTWHVEAPAGKQVKVTFVDIDTYKDYVKVFDHRSSMNFPFNVLVLRGHFNFEVPPVVSSRGGVTILYVDHNDGTKNSRGFLIFVTLSDDSPLTDDVIQSCGKTVWLDDTAPSITFRSPTYPDGRIGDTFFRCKWYFRSPKGSRLDFTLVDVNLDNLTTVFVGGKMRYMRLSNIAPAKTYHLQTLRNQASANIIFRKGFELIPQRGIIFRASFIPEDTPSWEKKGPMTDCGGAVILTPSLPSVEVVSPGYPNIFNGEDYICNWLVTTKPPSIVNYQVIDVNITGGGYVKVFTHVEELDSTLIQTTTGTEIPEPLNSTENLLAIKYHSDRRTSGRGAKFVVKGYFHDVSVAKAAVAKVEVLKGTRVVCGSTSMTVYVNRSLIDDSIKPGDLHFVDESCVGIESKNDEIMLHTRYDRCQTNSEQTDTHIVFSNAVSYANVISVPDTDITRQMTKVLVNIRCELDRSQLLNRFFSPQTAHVGVNELGYAMFTLSLDRYTNESFNELVADPAAAVPLGESLFFAVNLTSTSGLTVFINNCWTTPSPAPFDDNRYHLIDDGCKSDSTVEIYQGFGSTMKPFSFDAYTFIGDYRQIFIHCEAVVCFLNDEASRCAEGCFPSAGGRSRRQAFELRKHNSAPYVISGGPLHFSDQAVEYYRDGDSFSVTNGIIIGSVTGLACLILGIMTVIGLQMCGRRLITKGE